MFQIKPSTKELSSGTWSPENFATAKEALMRDGFVVLEDVVDTEHLLRIRERMLEEVERTLSRPDAPFNFVRGNLQQDPPPFPPFLFPDVVVNDLVAAVTHSILGDGVYNSYYSGNTAIAKSEQRQPVHVDHGHLWPGFPPAPAYSMVVNFPLVDMSVANGSTEIWPGSHLDTFADVRSPDIKIPVERTEQRRKKSPPIQPEMKLGSALIRDMRLWHAGMPNPSDGHRPMIAMIHYSYWYAAGERPVFPASSRSLFEHPILRTNADWVEGDIDHTKHNKSFDFHEAAGQAG